MPKVSVIIPVYNVEQYLEKCLDSVINQTLKDIEIICINDGSTDGSLEILERYAKQDSRIKVINQENQGLGKTRNIGIEIATAEYIIFVDSDDWIDLKTCEMIYNKAQETLPDIIQFDYNTYFENGKLQGCELFSKIMSKCYKFKVKNNMIFNLKNVITKDFSSIPIQVWDKAFSRKFIINNNIRFEETKGISEDCIFTIFSYILADKILYIQYPFYQYLKRKGSAVNRVSENNMQVFDINKNIKELLEKKHLYKIYEKAFLNFQTYILAFHYNLVPLDYNNVYREKCKEILCSNDYNKFLKLTKGNFSLIEKIFSIKNRKINGEKQKVLCVLGMKFVIPKFKKG